MDGETNGYLYPHLTSSLGSISGHSIQVDIVTTPTSDAGSPSVEEGRTKFWPPDVVPYTYDPKIKREAGSLAGCDAPLLRLLTRTFRHIPFLCIRQYSLPCIVATVKRVGHRSLKIPSPVFVTTVCPSSVKALSVCTGTPIWRMSRISPRMLNPRRPCKNPKALYLLRA
jgi:hypothetical protein